MIINVFSTLTIAASDNIRWPGAEHVVCWNERNDYSAIQAIFNESDARQCLTIYREWLTQSFQSHESEVSACVQNWGTHAIRELVAHLLVREWTRVLHNDQIDIILTDRPEPQNRVRSFKGLFGKTAKADALHFEQIELAVGDEMSVIFNRLTLSSSMLSQYATVLGDTWQAFGLFDLSTNSHVSNNALETLSSCFHSRNRWWRWDPRLTLPAICKQGTSMLFFQGLANNTTLELILYLPRNQLSKHAKLAQEQFGAEIFTANTTSDVSSI